MTNMRGVLGSKPADKSERIRRLMKRAAATKVCKNHGVEYSATKSPRKGVRAHI